ncbi:MAG: FtsX-like permease family protein [Hyphomicrobiaceae bacterium]
MTIADQSAVPPAATAAASGRRRLPLALRLALRDLRSGIGGFRIFIACVALGVMVIAAVGTLADALNAGLARQGQRLLGGDITFSRIHRRATADELGWLARQGATSETATLRSMARVSGRDEQALVEIKAIDRAYPLVGRLDVSWAASANLTGSDAGRAQNPVTPVAERLGGGALVDPILLARLGLSVGDTIRLGTAEIPISGTVAREPDALTDRLTFGPRVFLTIATLEQTGLLQPGTLMRWRYAVRLDAPGAPAPSAEQLKALATTARAELPEAGFIVRDRRDPSPQVSRTLERLRQFLTLLGLAALAVGGIGIANAVSTFIERRRRTIAVFKSLGASTSLVFRAFLAEIVVIAAIGIAIGLVLGLAVPMAATWLAGSALPIEAEATVSAASLALAAVYGFAVALLFALWPLGRAGEIRPQELFREMVAPITRLPRWPILVAIAVLAAVVVTFATATSGMAKVALGFIGGVLVVLALFWALGLAVTMVARRLPRPVRPELAIALGSIAAPGGLARTVVVSLGAGLSLLVAVALVDASLVAELTSRIPEKSPSYFVLDIPKGEAARFRDIVRSVAPGAEIHEAPMLRGRIVALKGVAAHLLKPSAEAQWVLNGDRGLTYSDTVPEGSKVTEGRWWDKDYAGEPLVSFEADLARRLDLKVGDTVTVNVLGRNVIAKVANLRRVDWESLAINFVMVFSPNTLRGAPHNLLATVTLSGGDLARDADVARALGRVLPSVTPIRVKDAINAFAAIFAKVMTAVRVAGSVTLAAGALVLAGALATAQRRRIVEAVIFKVLGATRWRIVVAHFVEYGALALVAALFAIALGGVAAYVAVTFALGMEFTWSWRAVGIALALASSLVAVFGGIGTMGVLSRRPIPVLRTE